MKNYYKILSEGRGGKLSLNKNSSHQDIKAAYRAMAIKHHPDKGGNPELFKKYQEAYEVLSNEVKRRGHNAELESGYSFSAHNNSASANLDTNDIDLKLFSKLFTIIMFPFFIIPLMMAGIILSPILLPLVIMANITKLALNLVLLPVITIKNMAKSGLNLASLPVSSAWNMAKSGFNLIYNEFSHDAEPDGEVHKPHDDAVDASNSFNKAPVDISNPHHSLVNNKSYQGSVDSPLTPIQRNTPKPESKPNTSFPSSYAKICGNSSNGLDKALKLLDDYTKGNSASSRFFHGHWNRHYVLEVNKIVTDIRGQKINSVTALLDRLNRIEIKNEKGSLARRKQYIELDCQSPDVESPNRTMRY